MPSQRSIEGLVGVFLLLSIFAGIMLAFKVSGLPTFFKRDGYTVTATFDEIGQLKPRAAVKIGGVTVGEVTQINLDPSSYRAIVSMRIHQNVNDIPTDSSASILTAGLLGDNYIAITPMYNKDYLKQGSEIENTQSAMILEKLIGQLVYKLTNNSSASNSSSNTATNPLPANAATGNTLTGDKK